MSHGPERGREVEPIVNTILTAIPGVYLMSGSLTVTALTSAVVIVAILVRRFDEKPRR